MRCAEYIGSTGSGSLTTSAPLSSIAARRFETTARSLTWGCYLLGRNPQAAARLSKEARRELENQPVDTARLKYSRMVVDETLRIYPPTALLARQNVEEDTIGGYTIPAGSLVVLVPYVVHRYPGLWDNPEQFDPQRFGEQAAARPKPAYIPFASGPRVCLGNSFALLEATMAVAAIATRYRLHLLPGQDIRPQMVGTLRPSGPVMMQIEPR